MVTIRDQWLLQVWSEDEVDLKEACEKFFGAMKVCCIFVITVVTKVCSFIKAH